MTQQIINLGTSANDGTGDNLRSAMDKTNDNFTELYGANSVSSNLAFSGQTISSYNTNGDIILGPNGTGTIRTAQDTIADTNNLRYIGNANIRHKGIYVGSAGIISDGPLGLPDFANTTVRDATITTPADGQLVLTDGNVQVYYSNSWSTISGATGGINNVVDDTSPQLGGNLDLNSKNIDGTGSINITGAVTASANVTGAYLIGNGSQLTDVSASSATTAGTVTTAAQPNITSVGTLTSVSVTGNITTTGNITGGNLLIGGDVVPDGNVTMGTGNITSQSGNIVTTSGNISGGNIITGGIVSATGNITSTGNISGGNIIGIPSSITVTTAAASGDGSLVYNNGTGVFTFTPADAGLADYGDANVATFLGSNFGSNTIVTTGNVTAANFIGEVTGNISGSATTATTAGTVTTAAQPNITSVGTLTSVSVTGNITVGGLVDGRDVAADGALAASAVQPGDNISDLTNNSNFIDLTALSVTTLSASGDGALVYNSGNGVFQFTPADAGASNYGDANVATYLGSNFGSNVIVTTGNITASNLIGEVTGDVTGNITSTGTSTFTTVDINGGAVDGVVIGANSAAAGNFTTIDTTGNATVGGNLTVTGSFIGNISGNVTGTVDADTATVSNLEVDNFKATAIVIESEGIGSNDNDTTLPTSAAVKDYVDNSGGSSQWTTSGSDIYYNTGNVGIGNTSPDQKLVVTSSENVIARFDGSGQAANATVEIDLIGPQSNGGVNLGVGGANVTDATDNLNNKAFLTADSALDGLNLRADGGFVQITAGGITSSDQVARFANTQITHNVATKFEGNATFDTGTEEAFDTLTGSTGTVTHDCNNGHVFYHTGASGDITANFTNLGLTAEFATNLTVIINQGATPYEVTAVQIGGAAQTINWQGGSQPTGNANGIDAFSFTILNDSGTYVVLGQMVDFT